MRSKEDVVRDFAKLEPTGESNDWGINEVVRYKRERVTLEILLDVRDLLSSLTESVVFGTPGSVPEKK